MKCDECKFAIPYRNDKYCSNGDSVKCFGVNTAFMDGCKYGEQENSYRFTDMEKRIFLAAMEREKRVCRNVDEECPDGAYILDDVCESIERKVKKALWK